MRQNPCNEEQYLFENREEFQNFKALEYFQSSDIFEGFSLCEIDHEHRLYPKMKEELMVLEEVTAASLLDYTEKYEEDGVNNRLACAQLLLKEMDKEDLAEWLLNNDLIIEMTDLVGYNRNCQCELLTKFLTCEDLKRKEDEKKRELRKDPEEIIRPFLELLELVLSSKMHQNKIHEQVMAVLK
jgi:hypothetical protein